MNTVIGIYGTRDIGFAYLAASDGHTIFGNYDATSARLANESATEALFAACAALTERGVVGTALVSIDRKVPGAVIVRSAEIEIGNPPTFGAIAWTEETVVR